jgi:IS5 family transposase
MKFHIGTDRRGVVHSLTATHAAEADLKQLPNLLHGEESVLYGDQGIAKNLARAQTMFALANLYAVRHRLLPPQVRCAS